MRVALIGGDDRVMQVEWPIGYEMSHFKDKGRSSTAGRLRKTLRMCDAAVVFLKWVGHTSMRVVKNSGVEARFWPGSINELSKRLPDILPLSHGNFSARNTIPVSLPREEPEPISVKESAMLPEIQFEGEEVAKSEEIQLAGGEEMHTAPSENSEAPRESETLQSNSTNYAAASIWTAAEDQALIDAAELAKGDLHEFQQYASGPLIRGAVTRGLGGFQNRLYKLRGDGRLNADALATLATVRRALYAVKKTTPVEEGAQDAALKPAVVSVETKLEEVAVREKEAADPAPTTSAGGGFTQEVVEKITEECENFLLEFLGDGPRDASDVIEEAKRRGIREGTMRRVTSTLAVVKKPKAKFHGGRTWELPLPVLRRLRKRFEDAPVREETEVPPRVIPVADYPAPPPDLVASVPPALSMVRKPAGSSDYEFDYRTMPRSSALTVPPLPPLRLTEETSFLTVFNDHVAAHSTREDAILACATVERVTGEKAHLFEKQPDPGVAFSDVDSVLDLVSRETREEVFLEAFRNLAHRVVGGSTMTVGAVLDGFEKLVRAAARFGVNLRAMPVAAVLAPAEARAAG